MPPATKKRKLDATVEKYLCFSCDTERIPTQFPDYNPTPDCSHLINTCKICLKNWIGANVEGSVFTTGGENGEIWGVKCPHPQCSSIMRNVNIEEAAPRKIYKKFDDLERQHIGNTTPGWRWCLAPGCRAGQAHETKVDPATEEPTAKKRRIAKYPAEEVKPEAGKAKLAVGPVVKLEEEADEAPADPNICICHECGAKACVPCDRPYHEGETCEDYQDRTRGRKDEEEKALRKIRQSTKACPKCARRIEKNGGCPSMICRQCNTNFCWNCAERYNDQGCGCSRRR